MVFPRGAIPSGYPHWHGIFVLLYRTNERWHVCQNNVQIMLYFGGHLDDFLLNYLIREIKPK